MNHKVKTLIYIFVFVVFIFSVVLIYNSLKGNLSSFPILQTEQGNPQTSESEENKTKAPDFTIYDSDGNSINLSDIEDKPIVLNFWASWCPPCKNEMPYFDTVYLELGDEIQFLMVDLADGNRETVEKGMTFIEDEGFSFPVYFDTANEAGSIYGVRSIPTTYFIDKDGYIVTGVQGAIDEDTLRKGIMLIQ
ncbi:TlpA family protein disulfide reductase [Lachnospiraceae bacterium OttesenSCG-928-D06]|nr:TlpA family protein disulfide reductase [Lachnospiraceae bacterium OttesenSCG-928-D06]